jgi:hypothetical protein
MEQSEIISQSEVQHQNSNRASVLTPQQSSQSDVQTPATDTTAPPYVYAIGQIEGRFPSLAVEKEFAQAVGRAETVGLTNQQTLYEVLSKPENRYLIRQLCWVFSIGGMETYLLLPRDPTDFSLLVEAIKPNQGTGDMDVVIGVKGSIAPAEMCNGLMVPIVIFDQTYLITLDMFIKAVPRPASIPAKQEEQFRATVREVLLLILQKFNLGATDEDRALNYLAMRYAAIYARAAESNQQNASLTGIQVSRSSASNTRTIMDVVFSYTNRQTNVVDMYCTSVDVTGEFPFLISPLSPCFGR